MDQRIVEITRRTRFCASHRLHNPALSSEENRRIYGICNNPNGHGHTFELEVTVRGPISSRTGMVINLFDLKRIMEEQVLSGVDHHHLNLDVPFLEGVIPTTENLAVVFWERLERGLESFEGCQLNRIRLYESRDSFAEYRGTRAPPPKS